MALRYCSFLRVLLTLLVEAIDGEFTEESRIRESVLFDVKICTFGFDLDLSISEIWLSTTVSVFLASYIAASLCSTRTPSGTK